ncbi:MAG: TIGR03364 family FAD-dependent oxidoreductase [Chitinophagaceae bacterium]
MSQRSAIVIGAGIVGLATARALAVRGYKVKLIERNEKAIGASIRNFGMVWPIGQPDGELYERAMLSRLIWKEVCDSAGIGYEESGSLHVAHNKDEAIVLQELADIYKHRGYQFLNADKTIGKSPVVVAENLEGGLYSPDEMIVDPRVAIAKIPAWLNEKYAVEFLFGKTVTDIAYPSVYTGTEEWEADEIYVCSGADFETLYPQLFKDTAITKCKLQMMRMAAQPGNYRIGPAICGSLSLVHYNSFNAASSLNEVKKRYSAEYKDYLDWGIHVMVSQNLAGELTVGDSHEYGLTHDPFDRQFINQLVLDYLKKFARFKDENVIETWNGIYAKLTNGRTHLVMEPEHGVTVINGLGGAGMTLSFGLCDQVINKKQMFGGTLILP